MVQTHSLGYPRIGARRELKFALEAYWQGASSRHELQETGAQIRAQNWKDQAALDLTPVGDFSFYDHVLDASFMLGHVPERFRGAGADSLDTYFRVARGRSAEADPLAADSDCECPAAGELTKWFDTNYHYIVPEFEATTRFAPNAEPLIQQIREAQSLGIRAKPVIIGPVTYLALGKSKDGSDPLDLLDSLAFAYQQLLGAIAAAGVDWVQIDEPILATDLEPSWQRAFQTAYATLSDSDPQLLLTTYFGELQGNLALAAGLPVAGVHLDAVNAWHEVGPLAELLRDNQVLSLGVINGRNVWRTDLGEWQERLAPIADQLRQRLWIAPSCSLLHVPVDLESEVSLDDDIKTWLAFARQKLEELESLKSALNNGHSPAIAESQAALQKRRSSDRVHRANVQQAVASISNDMGRRQSAHATRVARQAERLQLPLLPTTTIGSFPQTAEVRRTRRQFKAGKIGEAAYREAMQAEIERCVREQERLGLDVIVHGEAERNDMVEYFGEQLDGFAISRFGWVQSYGSRCVKPPILFGDVERSTPMTVGWTQHAQSLTDKPVKGMLTGPVTILNWSFVRDDQPRAETCRQLALAIRQEVLDLEAAGVSIIQIDEAALREGLPLRRGQWDQYLDWAIEAFRIAANGVADETQIHTHMCYSEFNDIIEAIARMDADTITIETSRSDMELLQAFERFDYPNQIGPGVYDIHSPNVPTEDQMLDLIRKASERIPLERLWVNPDCGLKTRRWDEVRPALANMVAVARRLRSECMV